MNVEQKYDKEPAVYLNKKLNGMTFSERHSEPMSRAYALGRYRKISQGARADT